MILYQFNKEILNHINLKQIVIHDYNVKDNRLYITLEDKTIVDEEKPKYIKLVFDNFKLTNETFEIKGHPIESVLVKSYVKVFNTKYFIAQALVIVNNSNPKEKITITGA